MRWRRRRFQRIRRKERERATRPQGIQFRHSDGRVETWVFNPPEPLPTNARVWNGKGEPDSPFVMTISVDATFYKCDVCGNVWQKPHRHTRRECNTNVAKEVLET